MDQVFVFNMDEGLQRFPLPGMNTSNHPTVKGLTCATQRYPARELHVEKHGDRDAMVCYHKVGTPQGWET